MDLTDQNHCLESMGTPQIGRKALHQAKDDSINLYEPHMEHYVGLGGRTDDSNPFDQIPALAADDPVRHIDLNPSSSKLIIFSSIFFFVNLGNSHGNGRRN